MYCPKCGLDNEEDLSVCKRCGEELKEKMTLKRKYGQTYNESNNLNYSQNTHQNEAKSNTSYNTVNNDGYNNYNNVSYNDTNTNYNDFGNDNSESRGYKVPESNRNQQTYYNNNSNNFPSNNYQNNNNLNYSYAPTSDYGIYYGYAGFWKRFLASVIDYLILGIGILILTICTFGIGVIVAPIAGWLYYALFESSNYQATPGKMALGIVVTDLDGNKISFGRASGRYWAKYVSYFTMYVGYIMAGFTEKKQALHDMIASCLVINK